MVFFSVVIPTYNRVDKLCRAIDSVLAQTVDCYEILIMDDGSTDGTNNLIERYSDPRIIYEWGENFGGPAAPRNRGLAKAKGEWICFLDADDWWSKDKLKVCFDAITCEVDIIYHDMQIVGGSKKFFKKYIRSRSLTPPVLTDLLVGGNVISNSSVVVRKSILDSVGGISEDRQLIAAEDYNTWLKISAISDKFLYIPSPLGYYLDHNENISKKDMSKIVRHAVLDFVGNLNQSERHKLESNLRYMSARFGFISGNFSDAKKNVMYTICHGRNSLKLRSIITMIQIYISEIFGRFFK